MSAAAADDNGPAGTYAAANDAAIPAADCCWNDDAADENDDGEDCDDDSADNCDSVDAGMTVGDEDANVVATVVLLSVETVVAEDGREPLPLPIRAPPPRDLFALLFLPKQVRGPVR